MSAVSFSSRFKLGGFDDDRCFIRLDALSGSELMTTDMKAAEKFYSNVVGWTSAPFPRSRHSRT